MSRQGAQRTVSIALAALAALTVSNPALPAPEEIQVYLDDLTKPGHFGADLHNSFALSGNRTPDYPGALQTHHTYRFTPEIYYGVSDTFEIGLYLLTTKAPGTGPNYDADHIGKVCARSNTPSQPLSRTDRRETAQSRAPSGTYLLTIVFRHISRK